MGRQETERYVNIKRHAGRQPVWEAITAGCGKGRWADRKTEI
jgi:hypothetical protein